MILTDALLTIGNFGPLILFTISLYLLRKTSNALYYYLIGFLFNFLLNVILKLTFKQPRPRDNEDLFKLILNYTTKNKCILPYDIYGMPSGHSQSVIFSTIFIYLMFKNTNLTLLFLLISIITIFQRVIELHHTVFQVIIGSLIGLIFGYFIFSMFKQKMAGNLSLKKDDNAFVLF